MNLLNIPILATALSIVIAWALFALFCSYLHEAIVQAKAERGRFLKQYLLKQLQDTPNGVNWASLLYQHGTVDMLSRSPEKPTSDISPELFARTLIEVAGNANIVQMHIGPAVKLSYNIPLLRNFEAATKVLQPSDVVAMFKQAFSDAELKAMVNGAVDKGKLYQELEKNIEQWYNELLERISLWYKKATRQRLFFLGAVIALILNVDSIQLFEQFKDNASTRNAMIAYYTKNQSDLQQQSEALKKAKVKDTVSLKQAAGDLKNVTDSLAALSKKADLPIGTAHSIIFKKQGLDFAGVLLKLLGIVISGIAASFGAPFWFDVLKKVYTPSPKK